MQGVGCVFAVLLVLGVECMSSRDGVCCSLFFQSGGLEPCVWLLGHVAEELWVRILI